LTTTSRNEPLQIGPSDPATPGASRLLEELDAYLSTLYPPESNHLLSLEALRRPDSTFFLAALEDRPVACGAIVNHQGEYGEIKRMFVRPEHRGLHIGSRMLDALEARARNQRLGLIRLETGIAQPEALRLYERAGYVRRGPFGKYLNDRFSVFMEKTLKGAQPS
jgi:putative acetyltransferase